MTVLAAPAPTRIRTSVLVAATVVVVAAAAVGIAFGPVSLPFGGVVRELLDRLPFVSLDSGLGEREVAVLWQLRVPRVVLGGLVGAALAMAGGAYQGVFRNPLADPYLLGVAAGAGLGATIVIVTGSGGGFPLTLAAFAGGIVAVVATYGLGRAGGSARSAPTLILAGVAVASFFTALQTFAQQLSSDTIREVFSWILGRLSTAGWSEVRLLTPFVVVSAAVLLLHRRHLDVLSVGEEEAGTLGLDTGRVRLAVVLAATLGTAAAVAVSGLIGFVGIVVPHAVRLVTGGSYRVILPLSCLVGAAFLILADVVARTVISPAELPIGVVTAFVGAPFFAVVLRSRSPNMSGLACTALVAGYRGRAVVRGIDLTVAPGEWVALIGPNGAGKSTLLKAIAGAIPSTGHRRLDGDDLDGMRRRRVARHIAVVPQVPDIPAGISVFDYVLLGRTPHIGYWGWETVADVQRVNDVIERLGLAGLAPRPVSELSGGERQRAVLGRALAQDAGVLLLDEPTAALDIGHQQQVMELVDELRRERDIAVLAAVHDLTLAAQYADRLVLMDGGVIVAGGPAGTVLSSDNLIRHYGASVTILHDDRGRPVVAPARPDDAAAAP